jgi:hypothetical protein
MHKHKYDVYVWMRATQDKGQPCASIIKIMSIINGPADTD